MKDDGGAAVKTILNDLTLPGTTDDMISSVLMFYTQLRCGQCCHNYKLLCHTTADTPLHYNMAPNLETNHGSQSHNTV